MHADQSDAFVDALAPFLAEQPRRISRKAAANAD
jgi:hypothetical protein